MSDLHPARIPDGWWEQAFDELYPILYQHRDLQEAVGFLEQLSAHAPLALRRILDLGCGGGRYLRALAEQGLDPVGLDLSASLLASARAMLPGLDLVRADMRRVPLRSRSFDWVMLMFTTFGYFQSEGENLSVLREVSRLLEKGGRVVLDHLDAAALRRSLRPRSTRSLGGLDLEERRWIDEEGPFVCKETRVAAGSGARDRIYRERVRLYEAGELEAMLASVGLQTETIFGGYDGTSFRAGRSERMILIARCEGARA